MMLSGTSRMHTAETRSAVHVVVLCAEERLRQLLEYWLGSMPIDVTIAAHGRAAAEVVAQHDRGVVLITDRTVPPWPGLPPLPALKQQNPSLRIVVIGGPTAGVVQAAGPSASGADVTMAQPLSRLAIRRSILASG